MIHSIRLTQRSERVLITYWLYYTGVLSFFAISVSGVKNRGQIEIGVGWSSILIYSDKCNRVGKYDKHLGPGECEA